MRSHLWLLCALLAAATLHPTLCPPLRALAADAPLDDAERAFAEGRFDAAEQAFAALATSDAEPLVKARAALGLSVIARQRLDWAAARAHLEAADTLLAAAKGAEDWRGIIRCERASALLAGAASAAEPQAQAEALLTAALSDLSAAAKGPRRDDPSLLLWQAYAQTQLGTLALTRGQLSDAAARFDAAAAAAESAKAPARQADALYARAQALWMAGDLASARAALDAAKSLSRDADDKPATARLQVALGQLLLAQGLYPEAQATFQLALDELASLSRARPQDATDREPEVRRYELIIYQGLAQAALHGAAPADAKPHLQRARALSDSLGANPLWLPQIALTQAELDLATGDKAPAALLADLEPLCATLSPEAKPTLTRCHLLRARLLLDQGQPDPALALLTELRASAPAHLQPQVFGLMSKAVTASTTAPPAAAQEVLASLPADDPARAPLLRVVARDAAASGDLDRALDLLDQAQALLSADPLARAQTLLAAADLYTGARDWNRAKRATEQALDLLTDAAAPPEALATARLSLARMHAARGKPKDALPLATAAATDLLAAGTPAASALAADALLLAAAAYDATRKPDDALRALEQALTLLATAPTTSEAARDAFLSAARLQAAADRPADAQASLEKALTFARAQAHNPSLLEALRALADLHIAQGRPADALPLLTEALPLLSNPADTAATQMALGFAHKASGDAAAATAAFTQAATLYKDLRNRPERKKAEAQLKALGAPIP